MDYEAFKNTNEEAQLHSRLAHWAERHDLKETSAEAALIEEFFRATWGYSQTGQEDAGKGFTLYPQFPIKGAGGKGGTGSADLAIGWFSKGTSNLIPQILCEFKDLKSALDAP